jgi:hypothetical protein
MRKGVGEWPAGQCEFGPHFYARIFLGLKYKQVGYYSTRTAMLQKKSLRVHSQSFLSAALPLSPGVVPPIASYHGVLHRSEECSCELQYQKGSLVWVFCTGLRGTFTIITAVITAIMGLAITLVIRWITFSFRRSPVHSQPLPY